MPCSIEKMSKTINMAFIIQNCDAIICSKIDQVDKHCAYDTKL